MKKQASIAFATERLKADFEALADGSSEKKEIHEEITSVLEALKSNQSFGKKIPKKLWPKFYKTRYLVNNLWKYDLRSGWRLTYTIKFYDGETICMILEWMTHKEYQRRFKYNDC